jgi:hypothetical protein
MITIKLIGGMVSYHYKGKTIARMEARHAFTFLLIGITVPLAPLVT